MLPLVTPIALTGANQQAYSGRADYAGFTIYETTGAAPARVLVYDNTSAAGTLLDVIDLAANESRSELYPRPIQALVGIYVNVVSGTVAGSVRMA